MGMTVNDELMTTTDPGRTRVHEHAWTTESAHRTSLGRVRYVICPACGTRRVDLEPELGQFSAHRPRTGSR